MSGGAGTHSMSGSTPPHDAWIAVNGEVRPLPARATLVEVLDALQVDRETAVAVAVNEHVVPKVEWPAVRLTSGDRVEIVRPMQGG